MDDSLIRDLIRFSDPLGVLSLYVEHDPFDQSGPQPTAPLEIRERISTLTDDLRAHDEELGRAVADRLRGNDDVARLVDPKAHGIGRALFIGVETGETVSVALQIPFRTRAIHHETPYIRPLVAAHDEGRDAGVLIVSAAGSRLLRWSGGEAEELDTARFELFDEQVGRDMSGPSPTNPADPRHGSVHRDKFDSRVDANRQRFLRDVVEQAVHTAESRGWDRLVLAGAPKVRSVARELFGNRNGLRLIDADRSWDDAKPHEIAQHVWPLLRSVHRDREQHLVETAIDRHLAGGAGAIGLEAVCGALNEGRVDHLVYDDTLDLQGFRSEEGTLHARANGSVADSGIAVHPEPLLVERMIERAIATDADVTPVGAAIAPQLEDHDGIAALLRW